MNGLRTFLGLPMPDEYRDILRELRRALEPGLASRLTWTRPEQFHLTLRFLGDTPHGSVEPMRTALAELAAGIESFTLQAAGGGFFPPRGAPRVCWAGLGQGSETCMALARGLEQALQDQGFPPEAHPFAAHLTLARVKEARRDPWEDVRTRLAAQAWPAFTVDSIYWWKSEAGPGGHRHTVLARCPLGPRK